MASNLKLDISKSVNINGQAHKKNTSKPPGKVIDRIFKRTQTEWKIFVRYKMGTKFVKDIIVPSPEIDLNHKRSGQVCVLTGGARGIGFEIVKLLLQLDYTVVTGVRNVSTMENGIGDIRKIGIVTGKAIILHLDLKSLGSVRNFADAVLNLPVAKRIDLLINNAGTHQVQYEITEDNIECHFQVNYLSHFLLTNLLLLRIKETAKSKIDTSSCHIINTSSGFHCGGSLRFDDLAKRKVYVPARYYCDTKLCQIIHAKAIQNLLKEEGVANIQMYAAAPGAIATDIWNGAGWKVSVLRRLMRTARDGAKTILYPALSTDISNRCGGKYFDIYKEAEPVPEANDEVVRNRLWNLSQKLIEESNTGV